jgi:soluble lytic murein transglycosylase
MKGKSIIISFFILIFGFASVAIFFAVRYPLNYSEYIIKYGNIYNISPSLVASLINEESSFDKNAISSRGALGLMQIMPQTAKYVCSLMNKDYEELNLLAPETNIKIGCFYLNYLSNKFDDNTSILCAYNAGEYTVKLWLSKKDNSHDGKTLQNIPYSQTKVYVNKILNGIKFYEYRLKI